MEMRYPAMELTEVTMYSKARVAGHPLHPMLIAFPVASYVGTVVGFALYIAQGDLFWFDLAVALSVVGAGSALLAAVPGSVDLLWGVPKTSAAKIVGVLHALLNLMALGLMIATAWLYFGDFGLAGRDARLGLGLSAGAVLCTLPAGFLGWMLVQTFHVGIRLTPKQTAEEDVVQHHSMSSIGRHRAA